MSGAAVAGNVLLCSNAEQPHGFSAKISDFGMCRIKDMVAQESLQGTYSHMAPEVIEGQEFSAVGLLLPPVLTLVQAASTCCPGHVGCLPVSVRTLRSRCSYLGMHVCSRHGHDGIPPGRSPESSEASMAGQCLVPRLAFVHDRRRQMCMRLASLCGRCTMGSEHGQACTLRKSATQCLWRSACCNSLRGPRRA